MLNLSEENKQIIEQFKTRVEKSRKNSDNHENLKFFNTEPDENNIINKNTISKNRLIVPSIKSFELQNKTTNNDIIIIQKENKSTQNLKNNIMKKNKDETNKINKKNSKNINNSNPKNINISYAEKTEKILSIISEKKNDINFLYNLIVNHIKNCEKFKCELRNQIKNLKN